MIREENISIGEPSTQNSEEERRTTNDENERNNKKQHERNRVRAANDEQLPNIFRLNIDCFEEVFDYLPLKDLVAIGKTCKRLNRVAGHCFHQNYGATTVCCEKDLFIGNLKVNCFIDFIEKLWINKSNSECFDVEDNNDHLLDHHYEDNEESIKNVERILFNDVYSFNHTKQYSYKSLNLIEMAASGASRKQFDSVKRFLDRVEYVKVWPESLPLDEGFFESFLKFCSNLKRLSVVLITTELIKDQNDWLFRNYPTLEHFELQMFTVHKIEAMENFLQLNPNIRKLSIYGRILWMNRDLFMIVDNKLDVLAITYVQNYSNAVELKHVCNLLNKLYERGLFKQLHLYFPGANFKQNHVNELVSLKGLVKLAIINPHEHFNLASLTNMEEIYIGKSSFINDLTDLPDTMTNLKRIQFLTTSVDNILVFIRYATKLNKLKVNFIKNGTDQESIDMLNLSVLNKERENLAGAKKITIYVRERVYLATKWAMQQTNYNLIEIKRDTSYDWQHEFDDGSTEK